MFQLYPFHGDNYIQVYGQMNEFLQQLDAVAGVEVKRDEIKEDTKNYLDYDRAVTTVTVCVHFVDEMKSAQTEQIAKVDALYVECIQTTAYQGESSDDDDPDMAELFLGGDSE